MNTKQQDQELSETIEIWEGIEGNSQLVVWLKELQRHRQVRREMSVIGYVSVKAFYRLEAGFSRFCALYPAEHVSGAYGSRRPDGCVAVYARRETGGAV